MWQQLICNKYLASKPLSQIYEKSGDSHSWVGHMKAKKDFLHFRTFTIKNDTQISFWKNK
jgi:hypothetical protein